MSEIHICLLSDQTIPNVIGILHDRPNRIVFVSTKRMEEARTSGSILKSLTIAGMDYVGRFDKEIVDQDSIRHCVQVMEGIREKYKTRHLTVNVTGGTKLMAVAAMIVFQGKNSRIVYTPFGRNEWEEIHPAPGQQTPLSQRLSVPAYVTAYGIRVHNKSELAELSATANGNRDVSGFIARNFQRLTNLTGYFSSALIPHRDDKSFDMKFRKSLECREEEVLVEMLGFHSKTPVTLDKYAIRRLTGEWLSEFCHNELAHLNVDDLKIGIELLGKNDTMNEFDVMFTKDNKLYLIECKTGSQAKDKDTDILYKIGALKQKFGLGVKGFLVSSSDNIVEPKKRKVIKPAVLNRAKEYETEVIHPDQIPHFADWISSKVPGLR